MKPKECVENEKILIKSVRSKLEHDFSHMILILNGSSGVKFCVEVHLEAMAKFMNFTHLGIVIF
jgi:hypothetical protein